MKKSIKKFMVGALALAVMSTTAAPATLVQAKKPAAEATNTDTAICQCVWQQLYYYWLF